MEQIIYTDVSDIQIILYNIGLIISFIFLNFKYNWKSEYVYFSLLFYGGCISDLSTLIYHGRFLMNVYQITILIWGIYFFVKSSNVMKYVLSHLFIFLLFILYIIFFIYINLFIHKDNINLVFSQLFNFIIPILLFFPFLEMINKGEKEKLFYIFWDLLIIQILASLFKIIVLQGYIEGWVGSLSGIKGGGMGTTLPLLGLFLYSIKTDLNLKSIIPYIIFIGLIFIGFSAGKRAVWLLFPIVLTLLLIAYKKISLKNGLIYILFIPLFIYTAVRVSPTLNPDKKIGGKFDLEYAIDYGLMYSAGIDESHKEVQSGVGRVGAVDWMMTNIKNWTSITRQGLGLEYYIYADHDDYSNNNYYQGISSRGNITGIVKYYMIYGIWGVILFLLFITSFLLSINHSNFAIVVILTSLFDYIFYNATILTTIPMLSLTIFILLIHQEQEDEIREREIAL